MRQRATARGYHFPTTRLGCPVFSLGFSTSCWLPDGVSRLPSTDRGPRSRLNCRRRSEVDRIAGISRGIGIGPLAMRPSVAFVGSSLKGASGAEGARSSECRFSTTTTRVGLLGEAVARRVEKATSDRSRSLLLRRATPRPRPQSYAAAVSHGRVTACTRLSPAIPLRRTWWSEAWARRGCTLAVEAIAAAELFEFSTHEPCCLS